MNLRKYVFYMTPDIAPYINEYHFSLFIIGNHERLPAVIEYPSRPTKRQIRKSTKFVMNHIKRWSDG
ncbi:DUF7279 family protein [Moellerella wisconsensis]|uniref:DUF7279 family protein n=1 Tax=Moellerella wisconsensis TaxID=158849 RepID=UPI003B227FB8